MASEDQQRSLLRGLAGEFVQRLWIPLLLVALVFLAGSLGFYIVGKGEFPLFDCIYMTSFTLTTVGYGEVLQPMSTSARLVAIGIMWIGMGMVLYAISTVTAFIVEHNLTSLFRERKMEKKIASFKGHIIVCGLGDIGRHVISELHTTRRPTVVIDSGPEQLEWLQTHFGQDMPFVSGDATNEEVLVRANIASATGVIACLPEDSQNMLITVEARFVNPEIRIVTLCRTVNLIDKFYRAGANFVIDPGQISGLRVASQMIRPGVVTFLDRMLRGADPSIRVDEVVVSPNSSLVGRSLTDSRVYEKTGLFPIALKKTGASDFFYNPNPAEVIEAETVLIVIGTAEQADRLRGLCQG